MSPVRLHSGKVRDVYDCGDGRLLMVTSDRISAFDVVLAEPIPDKGRVLTAMTAFWLGELADLSPSHLLSTNPHDFPPDTDGMGPDLNGRTMLVRRADMLPIECIVRGYLAGSAWSEYQSVGTMHGVRLPAGLVESARLPEPLFTPSTKATQGHDVNISFAEAVDLVGQEAAELARDLCVSAYRRASERAAERGIIIADTKFELGYIDGRLAICDEVLTPDSSRFWAADAWAPGATPASFDKQPVRDWLSASGWDKRPPPPHLAPGVVTETRERYVTAYERISGLSLADWPGADAERP